MLAFIGVIFMAVIFGFAVMAYGSLAGLIVVDKLNSKTVWIVLFGVIALGALCVKAVDTSPPKNMPAASKAWADWDKAVGEK